MNTSMMKHFLAIMILAGLIGVSCHTDHGLEPLPGKLKVSVYFRGTPPANTQGIYLIVAPYFPPHAINELFHGSNSLPIDQDTVETEIVLPFGHYESLSLWWYSTETSSNLADVLALPLDPKNSLFPLGFELSKDKPETHMELYASWEKVNRDAFIEGVVTFNGPFPENTLATAIAAYRYKPAAKVHYLVYLKSIDFSINKNPYPFKLPVRHGEVEYLTVVWLPEHSNLTEFHEVGVYMDPKNPAAPGKFSLKAGQTVSNVNINVDWSLLNK